MSDATTDEHQRIPYGAETFESVANGDALYIPRDDQNCPDCGVFVGDIHTVGCDVEQCPTCKAQLIGCDHAEQYLADTGDSERTTPNMGRVVFDIVGQNADLIVLYLFATWMFESDYLGFGWAVPIASMVLFGMFWRVHERLHSGVYDDE